MSRRRRRNTPALRRSEEILASAEDGPEREASHLEQLVAVNTARRQLVQAEVVLGHATIADPNDLRTQVALGRFEAAKLQELIEERRLVDGDHFIRIHDAIKEDRAEIAKLKAELKEHGDFIKALHTANRIFWAVAAAVGMWFGLKPKDLK